jgi:23S rRNA (pseudouridine1915-N3)-methyltransferase
VKVTVLVVGGVKGALATYVQQYEARMGHYWRFSTVEVEAGIKRGKNADAEAVKAAEEERILSRIPTGATVIALTRDGKSLGSRELARLLEEKAVRSIQDVVFVIGGAFGLGDGVLKRASLRLALSKMTFPHEVARLILVEQLYRAGTILKNEPYHKGP